MLKIRVIPSLLIKDGGLVKTVKFKNPKYVGDPINAIKIFNDKEVDELLIIDIDASKRKSGIDYQLLSRICKEAFMPIGYGGGIHTLDDIKKILSLGYEKIVINSSALENPDFIYHAASICGSQSIIVCIDVKKNVLKGYSVYDYRTKKPYKLDPVDYAKKVGSNGAGEILLYSVDRDGTFSGYEIDIIKQISSAVSIPVIALGGAGNNEDFLNAIKNGGASAVSAGSIFVFYGPYRAVLITYPGKEVLMELFRVRPKT